MNAKFSQQANHIHAQTTPANGKGPKVQSAKYSCSPLTPGTAEESLQSARTSPLYRQSPPCFVRHIP
jgi:hypothetical protein